VIRFRDRSDAGRCLGQRLLPLAADDVVILGLPRGGVPVAAEVAHALGAPLDVIVVRKIGVPFQPEVAMGAIGEGEVRIVNPSVVQATTVTPEEFGVVEQRERSEVEHRARLFRKGRSRLDLSGKTAVIVDDGIATGSTARAACQVARAQGATRVILAVPVAPVGWEGRMGSAADGYIAAVTPEPFYAVGQFYEDFSQTTDEEVSALLMRERTSEAADLPIAVGADPPPRDEDITIEAGKARIVGHLMVPWPALGVVIFAHGSGSGRHSPRNRFVASELNKHGFGTALFDLLTSEEEIDRSNVFDIDLLAGRLGAITDWIGTQPGTLNLPVGYFGASTGAAAALVAAAARPDEIAAVVSRGGRPDLAAQRLYAVRAPTLLIVGGADDVVIELNREAQRLMRCTNELVIVPGATHVFEEAGALERVADLAARWFQTHMTRRVT
jgi:putative phosphoribosyl transferase